MDCRLWGHTESVMTEATWQQQQQEKRVIEEEVIRYHHQLSGHEFEQTLGDSEGQASLECCSPWGPKESDTTQ